MQLGPRRRSISPTAASDSRCCRRVNPWAVVNATGYVRVDDAEREPRRVLRRQHGRRGERRRGVPPAAACRWSRFSSDLVFDGDRGRALRRDATRRGRSTSTAPARPKASAGCSTSCRRARDSDQRVLRTVGFQQLRRPDARAPSARPTWRAAADIVVSPTYVPDLVHATLDLLLDGETGLWHLANDGADVVVRLGPRRGRRLRRERAR